MNGGTCADSATDLSLHPGAYSCTCAINQFTHQPTAFGLNCETTEDDCTLNQNPCHWIAATPTCIDCARFLPSPTGYGQGPPNTACVQGYTCAAAGPEPEPEPASAGATGVPSSCASSPCLNGGTCVDASTEPTLHGDKYACTCATNAFGTPTAFGVNCETTEDDCTSQFGGDPCVLQVGTTCTDCARMMQPAGGVGFPVQNPACPNGYTCDAPDAQAGPGGGTSKPSSGCTDDPVCTSYSNTFQQAAVANMGSCESWTALITSQVEALLDPPLAVGTTLNELCPVSCHSSSCVAGGGGH
jgi:hypothetical protein